MYRGVSIIPNIRAWRIRVRRANGALFLCIFSVFIVIVIFTSKVSLFLDNSPSRMLVFPLGLDLCALKR